MFVYLRMGYRRWRSVMLSIHRKKAFFVLKNVLEYFNQEIPEMRWKDLVKDTEIGLPGLEKVLDKEEKTEQINREVDELKILMQDNIDKMFDRDLDILVQQSEDLSAATKIMVKQSKELNSSCPDCIIL